MAQTYGAGARPKRAGEEFARSQGGTSKKPRYDYRNPSTLAADEAEEDLMLDADVIGKSGAQTKRNAVNIDGYESDSDNDNFDQRAAEKDRMKQSEAKSKDAEEDDMFADLEEADGDEDEEAAREGKVSKKGVRFLDGDEIEGQIMSSKSGGHVSSDLLVGRKGKRPTQDQESESESSGDDEDRAALPDTLDEEDAMEIGAGSKRRHAPRLDAFNVRGEEEEGKFDESGNYVRKATDPDAGNDNWLDGVTKKDIKKAREAQQLEQEREEARKRKAMEADAVLTSDHLSTMIRHLHEDENAFQALARLNRSKPKPPKKTPKWKQQQTRMKHARTGMEVDEPPADTDEAEDPAEVERKKAIEAERVRTIEEITEAVEALSSRGQNDAYDAPREMFMRLYTRETGQAWQDPDGESDETDARSFEFRWTNGRDDGSAHGPYDAATMKAWKEERYFDEGVEFRREGEGEWSRLLDLP